MGVKDLSDSFVIRRRGYEGSGYLLFKGRNYKEDG